MPLAVIASRALSAAGCAEISVEVHLANGLPGFSIVGLADTEVRESRERVRAAIQHCEFEFPARRITVNLAPADLPKESGRFDLPIALGILVASGQLPARCTDDAVFAGELSLTGALRPVRGGFAMACGMAQARQGETATRESLGASASVGAISTTGQTAGPTTRRPLPQHLYLPRDSALDAARVQDIHVFGAPDLPSLCAHLQGRSNAQLLRATPLDEPAAALLPDMRDVIGQAMAKRALEVAAAGGHHVLMIGPPGAGKSMLAARLPGILPPMTDSEALASAALLSRCAPQSAQARWRQRPFRTPHHSASPAALIGGGNPPKPGEVTLAHLGVLFLDELPEFERRTLEMLREPLETGHITISRSGSQTDFPAACQLIAAMNPCPCGGAGDPNRQCRCTPDAALRYKNKLSGPLLDRIDIQLTLAALTPQELMTRRQRIGHDAPESSAAIQARVAVAHQRQLTRQGCANAFLTTTQTDEVCELDAEMRGLLGAAMQRFNWSARSHYRVLKLSRTIADLAGEASVNTQHIAEAIQYRRAL